MSNEHERALAFLRSDPLRYLMHLKYLHLYPEAVDCQFIEDGGAGGVLLSYAPGLMEWDRQAYPEAAVICLPVAGSERVAERLGQMAGALARGRPFVCKFCEPLTRAVFARGLRLRPVRAFISFTTQQRAAQTADLAVVASPTLDPRCAGLYANTPYSPAELAHYLADGGLTFTLFAHDEPVCVCLIYRNFENIWEIAGLYTQAAARRQGYARRVVGAALNEILARGGVPRYAVEDTNLASMRLAESLGMTAFLTIEHAWVDAP